jgi:hypothetical protein
LLLKERGPIQPPIQWVPGAFSLGLRQPGREDDHSPPSGAEVKECVELYLHSPILLHGVVLISERKRERREEEIKGRMRGENAEKQLREE